jgi:hypothetical protein
MSLSLDVLTLVTLEGAGAGAGKVSKPAIAFARLQHILDRPEPDSGGGEKAAGWINR